MPNLMNAFQKMRFKNDPTGIFTTQFLRYVVGRDPTLLGLDADVGRKTGVLGRTKELSDKRIRTYLSKIAGGAGGYRTFRRGNRYFAETGPRRGGQVMGRGQQGGRGSQSILQDLYTQFQQAMDETRKANEDRYKELIGGLRERREWVMGELEGYGEQQKKDVLQQYRQMGAQQMQQLVGRGLTGGGLPMTMAMGLARERQGALSRLGEQLVGLRTQAYSGLTKDILDAIERREDVGPSYEMLAQLAQQVGMAQRGGLPATGESPAAGFAPMTFGRTGPAWAMTYGLPQVYRPTYSPYMRRPTQSQQMGFRQARV